jgi:hypothetical protein
MRARWRAVGRAGAGALVIALLLSACAAERPHPADPDDDATFSADRLDFGDEGPVLDMLDPDERDAAKRSGISGSHATEDGSPEAPESKSETVGKVGFSVLTVAVSIGAAVAPFLLF